jgi:hypothetical protein
MLDEQYDSLVRAVIGKQQELIELQQSFLETVKPLVNEGKTEWEYVSYLEKSSAIQTEVYDLAQQVSTLLYEQETPTFFEDESPAVLIDERTVDIEHTEDSEDLEDSLMDDDQPEILMNYQHKIDVIDFMIKELPESEGMPIESAIDLRDYLLETTPLFADAERAANWLSKYDGVIKIFDAIDLVDTYELATFGGRYTNMASPESIANMIGYILGEEVLSNIVVEPSEELTKEEITKISEKLTHYKERLIEVGC